MLTIFSQKQKRPAAFLQQAFLLFVIRYF